MAIILSNLNSSKSIRNHLQHDPSFYEDIGLLNSLGSMPQNNLANHTANSIRSNFVNSSLQNEQHFYYIQFLFSFYSMLNNKIPFPNSVNPIKTL